MDKVFDRELLVSANQYFQFNQSRLEELLKLCDSISGDEELQKHGLRVHEYFFHGSPSADEAAGKWRNETVFPTDKKDAIVALLVISGLEHMMAAYRSRGIPETYLVDSLRDTTIWMDHYKEQCGKIGIAEVGWVLRSLQATLFRLGRLQFMLRPFGWKLGVAVHRADRMPVAFFTEPTNLRSDGLVDGTNGIYDPDHGWQSKYSITDSEITGIPLHPGGFAVQKELRLSLSQWEIALRCGDGMLDIHIPKDGKMDFKQCHDSILAAMDFFALYFPEKTYKVIHLCTWFLDTQLQELLPAQSNIVRFKREFYLFPVKGTHFSCYERVFGRGDMDIASAPESTALQKAVKKFVLAGNHMQEYAGFILPEDMKRFGEAQYQTKAADALDRMLES